MPVSPCCPLSPDGPEGPVGPLKKANKYQFRKLDLNSFEITCRTSIASRAGRTTWPRCTCLKEII